MMFTVLPLPVHLPFGGAGVAGASGENWLGSNGTAYGTSVGFSPFENRRAIDITVGDPAIPANYKVPINIHRGNETIEYGTWTVNSKVYNNRVAFTVHIYDALSTAYPLKVIIDTASLVTGGFFGGSTSGYAKTSEFTSSSTVTDTMKYWVTEVGAATPVNFNTSVPGTTYYVKLPSGLTANTDHTMYMYVDPDISAASTNYSGADTFSFFEHFDTTAGNLTAFLAAYTSWEADPPVVATTEVVLTSGTSWSIPAGLTAIRVLTVAGGGGGGYGAGGGGGAGGVVYNATYTLSATEIAAGHVHYAIGGGGAGSTAAANKGTNGVDSTFGDGTATTPITAKGGGGGGSSCTEACTADNGADGGSGGGGTRNTAGTAGSENQNPNQGYNGGAGGYGADCYYTGGGGGGAGAVGQAGTNCVAGGGGAGADYSAIFTSTFGDPSYRGWVAGGGGGGVLWGTLGAGGKGGGGRGGDNTASPIAGGANTGGGGGGGGSGAYGSGVAGGSGVIVIRYGSTPIVSVASSSLTLAGSVGLSGIATKTSGAGNFTIQNFRALFRIASVAGVDSAVGVFDAAGIGNTSDKDGTYWQGNDTGYSSLYRYVSNVEYSSLGSVFIAPNIINITKYGTQYTRFSFDDVTSLPNFFWFAALATDVAHKIMVTSYSTNDIDIDWIAVAPEIATPPIVLFPNILYEKAGTVFLDNKCLNWPYDIAFTDNDGNTTLNWWPDPLTDLTRQPGDSMQATVRVTDSLAGNVTIYIYYGHDNITTTQAECSPTATYDVFDAFTNDDAWTVKIGSWTETPVIQPSLYRSDVGNVAGGAGRFWGRMSCVVKWANNDYRMIYTSVLHQDYAYIYSAPYAIYESRATSPSGSWSPGKWLYKIGKSGLNLESYWVESAKVYPDAPGGANRVYVVITGGAANTLGGCELVYSDDFENWTVNTNGPFLTLDWLTDNSGTDFPDGVATTYSFCLVKSGSTYYVFIYGIFNLIGGSDGICWASTTDAPADWDADSFTYGDRIITADDYWEAGDVVFDGDATWYMSGTNWAAPMLVYWTCPAANFPGSPANWTSRGEINHQDPLYFNQPTVSAASENSPRFLYDDGYWYMYYGSNSVGEDGTVAGAWCPHWITIQRSTTLNGAFTAITTDSKYKQATTDGFYKTYLTGSSVADGEIITELNIGRGITNSAVGILFRGNATADTGYWAMIDYNAGVPCIKLYAIFNIITYIALGTTYNIPSYPIPQFSPGYPWRLRVQFYGSTIKVAYSAWGNEWIETHNVTDGNFTIGLVGLCTGLAEGYFNNFRVRGFVLNEPVVGQAESEEYNVDISNTPSSHDFGVVQPSSVYSTGLGKFTLTNNSSFAVDVSISGTDMIGGTTWTLSDTGAAGINTVGLKAILGNSTGNATTGSYKPNAHPESTSGDSYLYHADSGGAPWATFQGGAGTYAASWDGTLYVDITSHSSEVGNFTEINRSITCFDLSTIPDVSTIVSATLYVYQWNGHNTFTQPGAFNVYSSTPASPKNIVAGDYDSLGTSAYCDTEVVIEDVDGWKHFTLNATGRTAIKDALSGNILSLGLRESIHDAANSPPTWTAGGQSMVVQLHSADNGDSDLSPYIEITYEYYDIVVKKTAPFNWLVQNLLPDGNTTWGLELLTPTNNPFSDGVQRSGNSTLTAEAS